MMWCGSRWMVEFNSRQVEAQAARQDYLARHGGVKLCTITKGDVQLIEKILDGRLPQIMKVLNSGTVSYKESRR